MPAAIDLTGQRFFSVVVVKRLGKSKAGGWLWLCRCDCGSMITRESGFLRYLKSCGCARNGASAASQGRKLHGMSKHPDFNIWIGMRRRCVKRGFASNRYHDRGIRVCDRWMNDFAAFIEDMGPRPTPDHSLDRIDNNKGYEPSNCRWATAETQSNNRRDNVTLAHEGETLTIAQWARLAGLAVNTFRGRLDAGETFPYILRPAKTTKVFMLPDGSTGTAKEVARVLGTTTAHVYRLEQRGQLGERFSWPCKRYRKRLPA